MEEEDTDKSKTVRKAVRAIYETEAGEGGVEAVKTETSANYKAGKVFYKGYLAAEWKGLTAELKWSGLPAAAKLHAELMAR